MQLAEHVVATGERLVLLGGELTADRNETFLLAHTALNALLLNDALLSHTGPHELRGALFVAAEALGIGPPGRRLRAETTHDH